jgi:toxin ParE1/3/4
MRYRVSKAAARELDEIFLYWARRVSLAIADRVVERITDRFRLLGEFPDAGKAADDIAPGVRLFPAGKYLIYYRKTSKGTNIVHIIHSARDQKAAFNKPNGHE